MSKTDYLLNFKQMSIKTVLEQWDLAHLASEKVKQVYVFGYGSIISPTSLATTLGDEALKLDCPTCYLNEFVREWTAFVPLEEEVRFADHSISHIAYLNIRAVEGDHRVNGVLVPVTMDDLQLLIQRENIYGLVEVTPLIEPEPLSDHHVVAFVSKVPGSLKDYMEHSAVRKDYVALVKAACEELGDDFLDEYLENTLPENMSRLEPEQIPGAVRRFPRPI